MRPIGLMGIDRPAEVERLNATVRERSVPGEIIDMEYASSIGDYFGSFRCPECEAEVEVRLGEKRRRCACGIVWGYDVSATVTREDE